MRHITTVSRLQALATCLLLVLTLGACSNGNNGNATVQLDDAPGALAVGRRTDVLLRDVSRSRDITATYWYPAAGDNQGPLAAEEGAALIAGAQRFPLVILIHGLGDNAPSGWSYLGPHLASHGYIVMAPSTGSGPTTGSDITNHPGDVSFLISTALGDNDADPMFVGRVEAEDILVGGFSFGGLATYLFAYEEQYQDARVSAVITIAPAVTSAAPVNPALSLLVLQGTEDPLVAYDSSLNLYEAADAPKYLISLQGAGHGGFTGSIESPTDGTMAGERMKSITRVTVLAYLTSLFADSSADRAAAQTFLQETLDADNSDVGVMFE